MEISFHGAAKTVTGSKHLITLADKETILLDCGMFQGLGPDTNLLNRNFGFDASKISYLILSHAHVDHSGLIPKLVKDGFKGNIYCTPATYDLCTIMLRDSAMIQEADARFINKKRELQKRNFIEGLYNVEDVEKCLLQFICVDYNESISISPNIELMLSDNGHILGSATINLRIKEGDKHYRLAFTGDIGRYGSALLKDPVAFPQADILICESTYGDRLHEKCENAEKQLLETIIQTCKHKKGKVIIPAFSLGRTQELVYSLNKLNLKGLLPEIKIFVDSPLAVNATNIMRKYALALNDKVQAFIESRPDPFGFDWLNYITNKRESQALNEKDGPFVLISSAGMAEAGRIKHHLMNTIGDKRNTIMIVGYAEGRSLAGRLRNGEKVVSIYGKEFKVNAEVKVINSLSAHGDYKEMLQYLSCQDPKITQKVFVVHGEPEVQFVYMQKLKQQGFKNISIPSLHEHFYL
jgi:metallo-beta-lactamase family protein